MEYILPNNTDSKEIEKSIQENVQLIDCIKQKLYESLNCTFTPHDSGVGFLEKYIRQTQYIQQKITNDLKNQILFVNKSVYEQSDKVKTFVEACDRFGLRVKFYDNKVKENLKKENIELWDFILFKNANDTILPIY